MAAWAGLRAPEVPPAAPPATSSAYSATQASSGSKILVNVLPPAARWLFHVALGLVQLFHPILLAFHLDEIIN